MSDEDGLPVERPAPKVKASKPRVNVSRFEKRAAKIADTIRQAANWSCLTWRRCRSLTR